jgi:hypothetical protein
MPFETGILTTKLDRPVPAGSWCRGCVWWST